jgi:hypothetical protein
MTPTTSQLEMEMCCRAYHCEHQHKNHHHGRASQVNIANEDTTSHFA